MFYSTILKIIPIFTCTTVKLNIKNLLAFNSKVREEGDYLNQNGQFEKCASEEIIYKAIKSTNFALDNLTDSMISNLNSNFSTWLNSLDYKNIKPSDISNLNIIFNKIDSTDNLILLLKANLKTSLVKQILSNEFKKTGIQTEVGTRIFRCQYPNKYRKLFNTFYAIKFKRIDRDLYNVIDKVIPTIDLFFSYLNRFTEIGVIEESYRFGMEKAERVLLRKKIYYVQSVTNLMLYLLKFIFENTSVLEETEDYLAVYTNIILWINRLIVAPKSKEHFYSRGSKIIFDFYMFLKCIIKKLEVEERPGPSAQNYDFNYDNHTPSTDSSINNIETSVLPNINADELTQLILSEDGPESEDATKRVKELTRQYFTYMLWMHSTEPRLNKTDIENFSTSIIDLLFKSSEILPICQQQAYFLLCYKKAWDDYNKNN